MQFVILLCVICLRAGAQTIQSGINGTSLANSTEVRFYSNSTNATEIQKIHEDDKHKNVTGHLNLNLTAPIPPLGYMEVPQNSMLFPPLVPSVYSVPPEYYTNMDSLYSNFPPRIETQPTGTISAPPNSKLNYNLTQPTGTISAPPNSKLNYNLRPDLFRYSDPVYQALINQQKPAKYSALTPEQPSLSNHPSSYNCQGTRTPVNWGEYWNFVAANPKYYRELMRHYQAMPRQMESLQPQSIQARIDQPSSALAYNNRESLQPQPIQARIDQPSSAFSYNNNQQPLLRSSSSPISTNTLPKYNLESLSKRPSCPSNHQLNCGSPKIDLLNTPQC